MDESDFMRHMTEWQPFYSTVAAVSATLTGLLFVSLSINREKLTSVENRVSLRAALRSFGDLLFVLGIALVLLIPKLDSGTFSLILLGLGVIRMLRVFRQWRQPFYQHLRRRSAMETAREYALPFGSCLGLCVIAGYLWLGHYKAIYGLILIVIELITTASRSAWKLLMLDGEV